MAKQEKWQHKVYEDVVKLSLPNLAKTMSDITYCYNETVVPEKHYKDYLSKAIEETVADEVQMQILNTVFKTIESLWKESPALVTKALICLEKGIKPNDIRAREYQALMATMDVVAENNSSILSDVINGVYDTVYENGIEALFEDTSDSNGIA